jgi:hypothetical protein
MIAIAQSHYCQCIYVPAHAYTQAAEPD